MVMTNSTSVQEKMTSPKIIMVPFYRGGMFKAVQLTVRDMTGLNTEQELGFIQGKAADMGFKRLSMAKLEALRKTYEDQPVGEHGLVMVHDGECNMYMIENHTAEGPGIAPHQSGPNSKWRADDLFWWQG